MTDGRPYWADHPPRTADEAFARLATLAAEAEALLPNAVTVEDRLWRFATEEPPDEDHCDPPAVEQLMVQYRGQEHARMQRLYEELTNGRRPSFFSEPEEFLDHLADAFPAPFVLRQRL